MGQYQPSVERVSVSSTPRMRRAAKVSSLVSYFLAKSLLHDHLSPVQYRRGLVLVMMTYICLSLRVFGAATPGEWSADLAFGQQVDPTFGVFAQRADAAAIAFIVGDFEDAARPHVADAVAAVDFIFEGLAWSGVIADCEGCVHVVISIC